MVLLLLLVLTVLLGLLVLIFGATFKTLGLFAVITLVLVAICYFACPNYMTWLFRAQGKARRRNKSPLGANKSSPPLDSSTSLRQLQALGTTFQYNSTSVQQQPLVTASNMASFVQPTDEMPPLEEAHKFIGRFKEYFHQVIMAETKEIDIVWESNIVFLATWFIETYRKYRDANKPHQVLLAYHYTDKGNLDSIERNGLLSKPERTKAGVECKRFSGEAHGSGVYCCHDPTSTKSYGNTGILIAILRGNVGGRDTVGTNAVVTGSFSQKNAWSVLKTAEQVLPLVLLPANFVDKKENIAKIKKFHIGLQAILDEFFNHGKPAPVHDAWFT